MFCLNYFRKALIKAKSYENEDSMDIDVVEEFQPNMLDVTITLPKLKKYNLHVNDIFIGCHFLDNALIQCHENSRLNVWELDYLFSCNTKMSSNVVTHSFLNFPKSSNKNFPSTSSTKGIICSFI